MLRTPLSTKPALKAHQGAMNFPALQPWGQLGRIPGGQGSAFRRQASWGGLSLPVASHTLILAWRVSAFGVRTSQECSPCPHRAQFPCSQGSSIPAL